MPAPGRQLESARWVSRWWCRWSSPSDAVEVGRWRLAAAALGDNQAGGILGWPASPQPAASYPRASATSRTSLEQNRLSQTLIAPTIASMWANGYLQVRRGSLDCDDRSSRVWTRPVGASGPRPGPQVGVPEPGLRRLAHAAALPEETAIVDDSDLRSFGHPRFGRRFVAHNPGVVSWGTPVVSAFPASTSVPSSMRTRSRPDC